MADENKELLQKKIRRLAGEAAVKYGMIRENDRILAAVSGGKDSLVMLEILHQLKSAAPIRFEVIAATFDPGFPGFNLDAIAGYCRNRGFEHKTVSMQIGSILEEKNFTESPCVLCSRLRRGKLYGLARELDCGVLALGQHLDDILISFLMSVCRGQGISTMAPCVPPKDPGKPRVIRPLALVPEKWIIEYAKMLDFPRAGECQYKEQLNSGDRKYFADLLGTLEERIPNLRSNMAKSLGHLEPEHLLVPLQQKDVL